MAIPVFAGLTGCYTLNCAVSHNSRASAKQTEFIAIQIAKVGDVKTRIAHALTPLIAATQLEGTSSIVAQGHAVGGPGNVWCKGQTASSF